MPIFKDAESAFQLVPPGDYILCVFQFESELSNGRKTRGSELYNIVFIIEGTNAKVVEKLIDHESCDWKIDTFLKSCGIRNLPKGQEWYFDKAKAQSRGVPWINPMGLRCHARVENETYTSSRTNKPVTKNSVATYYTDRAVLPPDAALRQKPMGAPKAEPSPEGEDEETPF